MGITASTNDNKAAEVQQNYKVVRTSNTGVTCLEDKKTGKEFILKQLTTNNLNDFTNLEKGVQRKKNSPHQHLLAVQDLYTKTQNHFCSNVYKIFVIIEHPFRNLFEEVDERKKTKQWFSQNELWSILYSCVLGIHHLYDNSSKHEMLCSSRIYIQKDGIIKVGDPYLIGYEDRLISKNPEQHFYPSPEQINNHCYSSGDVSDIFTLGMIMTEAATLNFVDDIYQSNHTKINQSKIRERLTEVKMRYGDKFRNVIERMLKMSDKHRITIAQIEEIIENENFQLENTQPHNQAQRKRVDEVQPSKAPQINNQNYKPINSRQPTNTFTNPKNMGIVQQPFIPPPISYSHYGSGSVLQTNNYVPSIPAYDYLKSNIGYQYSNNNYMNNKFNYSNNYTGSIGYRPYEVPSYSTYIPSTSYDNIYTNLPTTYTSTYSTWKPANDVIYTPNNRQLRELTSNNLANITNEKSYAVNKPIKITKDFEEELTTPIQKLVGHSAEKPVQHTQDITPQQNIKSGIPNSTIPEVNETELSVGSNDEAMKFVNEEYDYGSKYEGYKVNGMRHGFGKFYYQDGGYYEGEWKNNKMDGFAKLYYQNGEIAYEGNWKNDQFHGQGQVFNDNPKQLEVSFDYTDFTELDDFWLYYKGEFMNDAKHGKGSIKLSNGQIFQGNFEEDIIKGEGKFYCVNGDVISGFWRDNKLVQKP